MPSIKELFAQAQILHHAGRFRDAQAVYAEIIEEEPEHADALNLLGTVLAQQGRPKQAVGFMRRATQAGPEVPNYFCNLGVVLLDLGRYDESKRAFERALKIDRHFADAYYNLGKLFKQMELFDAALMSFEQARSIQPERIDTLINMGNILFDLNRLDEAIECFETAAVTGETENRQVGRALINLGNAQRRKGDADAARDAYTRFLARRRHDGLRIKSATTLPIVQRSWEHINHIRRAFEDRVAALLEDDLLVTDPSLETSTTTFFLAYHGLGDRHLQELVAKLHLKSCPWLDYVAPHVENPPSARGKIRVGFLSTYFRRHSVGRLMQGVLARLPKELFEIVIITQPGQRDPIVRAIEAAADKTISMPTDLAEARAAIVAEELDILFYADIGMDVRTYFLAFGRLAPVQCVTWGHPDTTGIPNMDYFLSSTLIEPDGAAAEYSESLYPLATLPTYYLRPEIPGNLKTRDELGLASGKRIYLCPQSVIKHHPDLDAIVAGILRGDGDAEVMLVEGAVPDWTAQVAHRMGETIPDVAGRISSIPRMGPDDFLALMNAADVIFDPPHFSGGNTSFEAFALGKPVVAHDGAFMRGRVTAGMYRAMGITDATGQSPGECAEIALSLGLDKDRREDMEVRITGAGEALFEHDAAVREFERFLVDVFEQTRH
ncbi:MAG: tetratricopeptide repeat protein [Rhodospirillaceae bacterium]|nr:tetratricopeptide repeat protein [Rhodospirillaceae bacterium]MBT3886456.1 tetratricopeptide repeat protein [Rhodospirillaceae bacterium]MBT4117201.1 tetratricopeptide repeat protein [Rhodospirillaceae bacterium]MBT4670577.1 tetratricopeptide repeat protein [Rhodospirillaceae bacterium]MBT4718111.1 tetratricopeptide repeat protein [Rhodospirillaceae bacterium]